MLPRHVCHAQALHQPESADYPKWIQHNLKILGMTLEEIEDYSEGLRESGDPKSANVTEVIEWLQGKEKSLTEGCMIAGGKEGRDCNDLDQLGRLVQTLGDCCGVEEMVHVLSVQCHAEKGETGCESGKPHLAPMPESTLPGHALPTAEELAAIFNHVDRNRDGKLNMAEFREAMEELGDPLSAPSVQLIAEAFDIHGSVEMQQFLEIVSAEEIRSHTQDSKVLRRMASVAKNSMEQHTPDWGS